MIVWLEWAVRRCLAIEKAGPTAAGRALAFFGAVLFGLEPAAGAQEDFEVMEEIPASLLSATDELGANWVISGPGHLTNAGAKLFEHGMFLNVGGTDFKPMKGVRDTGSRRWILSQSLGNVVVGRDVYFDGARGGVRYLDTFKNESDEEVQIEAEYRSAFRSPWSQVYTAQGRPFEGKLGSRDSGIFLKMTEEGARSGVLFLVSGERSEVKPELEILEKEVRFHYSLTVPSRSSLSIVQWVVQRRKTEPSEVRDLTAQFYRQRLLADARIPKELRDSVVNFEAGGGAQGEVEAHNGPLLVALREAADRIGVIRTGQDVLWVAKESQLTGSVEGGALSGTSRFGEFSVSLDELAGLRGGGGRGRDPRIFLRDGTVLQSEASLEGLKLVGTEGWLLDLDVAQVEYLFMKIATEDGLVSPDCDLFLEFHSGDVCGVKATNRNRLEFMTPWGAFEVPMREIESMSYLQDPSPRYRVHLKDGSKITAFLMDTAMTMKAQRFGEVNLKTSELSGLWSARGEVPDRADTIEEIDDLSEVAFEACLLKGENLVAGRLADEEIHVISGTAVTGLKPAEISSISRAYDEGSEMMPVFEIELKGGDLLRGRLREDTLQIAGTHLAWSVPVSHFLGMQVPLTVN